MNADLLNEIHRAIDANKACGKGIPYIVALLECAANYIEKLEALVQNGQSAIDTNKRLDEKIKELQSRLKQVTQEKDEFEAALMPFVSCEQINDLVMNEFVIHVSFFDVMPMNTFVKILSKKIEEMQNSTHRHIKSEKLNGEMVDIEEDEVGK